MRARYNHACVILYSVGNEIQEIGTERGAEINRMLCNAFKELDATRFTTNGMNALNAAGAKVYPVMQELAPLIRKDAGEAGTNDNSGSNAINSFMKLMEGEAGDAFAVHPIVTEVLEESSESMDIIGFNYLTGRHLLEGELHPNKCDTPQAVSKILTRIAIAGQEDRKGLSVYDPCMGSGSLLLNAKKYAKEPNYIKYYGQELNTSTYNLARMNMFLHGIVPENH